ncbi:MAG: UDPGP type 1 family protein [Lentisphaeria bacterium]|nr:UDPGP type 1 family protein [Lentisphaeria bacterium]
MKESLKNTLQQYNQTQLLRFENSATPEENAALEAELEKINFAHLDKLIKDYVLKKPEISIPADLQPAPYFPLVPQNDEQKKLYADAENAGRKLISDGKVACLIVAGGQGTRLGYDGPKGTYPIGPVSGRSLFEYFALSIRRNEIKYNTKISWYVMTSLLNNQQTVDFFEANNYFGLDKKQVFFFVQGTMPAIDYQGKLLMSSKSSLSLSPDGHGGTLLALKKSGALEDMKAKGIEHISYFQVDNPLVPVLSPLFIGLHAMEKSEMSAIMLAKTNAFEKLGNFCLANGKLQIIEYSDLPDDLAQSLDENGKLRFISGSPAIHVISREFIEKLTADGTLSLPAHRADKKVPYIDENGEPVKPESPNAVKLETFIFDALQLADKTMVLESDRKEVFGPTKNATGVDSAESCREMLIARDCRRLEAAGVKIPRNTDGTPAVKVEISPLAAVDDEDVAIYVKNNNITEILSGTERVLA